MSTTSKTECAKKFFAGNGKTYDQISLLSTLGFDSWWKKKILKKIPKGATSIIDQACGTGILTVKIARLFPHAHVIGVEMNDEYLTLARQKAKKLHVTNIEFIPGRAEDVILEEGVFDCITSAYLAKYAGLDRLTANAHGMLRPGGVLIMHDLTHPTNPAHTLLWKLHFKFLQTCGAWKYPEWEIAFRELPLMLEATKWVDELIDALAANHFLNIKYESLAFGASAIITSKK